MTTNREMVLQIVGCRSEEELAMQPPFDREMADRLTKALDEIARLKQTLEDTRTIAVNLETHLDNARKERAAYREVCLKLRTLCEVFHRQEQEVQIPFDVDAEAQRLLKESTANNTEGKEDCKHENGTWFDRSISYASDGTELGMVDRCNDCGEDVSPAPSESTRREQGEGL